MKKRILKYIRKTCGVNSVLKNQEYFYQYFEKLRFNVHKNKMIEHILHDSESGITDARYTDHEIIVSLTTYGKRIYDVSFAIESIMQQSIKANRIILWLDDSFQGKRLPESLYLQQKRGLEIAFCKDIGPHTKLIPSLRRFPNDAIITIDDDAIYDFDLLERLIIPYLSNPSYIYCHRMHKMKFDKDGTLLPYMKWDWRCTNTHPSHLNFATGVGGILYPPHSLDEEVFNEEIFLKYCRTADDVWFKAMAIKKGTKVEGILSRDNHGEDYLSNTYVQDVGLYNANNQGEMLNDKQIDAVFTKYNIKANNLS